MEEEGDLSLVFVAASIVSMGTADALVFGTLGLEAALGGPHMH